MRKVRLNPKNYFPLSFSLTLFMGFLGLNLSGCATSRESVCQEIPVSSAEITAFKSDLDSRQMGRRIASVQDAKPSRNPPGEKEVAEWMDWTERALKRSQSLRDSLATDRTGRKALPFLNEASLSLVSLHGFLEQKKWRKAYKELQKVEENLSKVSSVACISAAPETDRRPSAVEKPKKNKRKAPVKSGKASKVRN